MTRVQRKVLILVIIRCELKWKPMFIHYTPAAPSYRILLQMPRNKITAEKKPSVQTPFPHPSWQLSHKWQVFLSRAHLPLPSIPYFLFSHPRGGKDWCRIPFWTRGELPPSALCARWVSVGACWPFCDVCNDLTVPISRPFTSVP